MAISIQLRLPVIIPQFAALWIQVGKILNCEVRSRIVNFFDKVEFSTVVVCSIRGPVLPEKISTPLSMVISHNARLTSALGRLYSINLGNAPTNQRAPYQ